MKKHLSTIILVIILLGGLGLLLYPSVSNWWNSRTQSKAIASYVDALKNLSEEENARLIAEAQAYNKALVTNSTRFLMNSEERARYNKLLSADGSSIMGYIEIPTINVTLPVYHSTDEDVLQVGVGHLEGSSLPVGGSSTHCVLTGHRGLPSAKLFTNLNKLEEGNLFHIRTLNTLYTYQVDKILIVKPGDMSPLDIAKGKDYCTLVTCTPYGINTHRLLVRGIRVENPEDEKTLLITSEAYKIDSLLLVPIIAIPILLILFIVLLAKPKKTPAKKPEQEKTEEKAKDKKKKEKKKKKKSEE